MKQDQNLTFEGAAFVVAIPCQDELWAWVQANCPEDVTPAEFFRFLSTVGMQFMRQSMAKLHTTAAGVLDYMGYYE